MVFFFENIYRNLNGGTVVVVIVWYLDLQQPVQAMHVVSLNPAHGEVYLIQLIVISVVFLPGLRSP